MISQKSTIANAIRTLTKARIFLLVCFLFMVMAMLPLRTHATTGSDYCPEEKYRWTVYWHVDNSYDVSGNKILLYTYYGYNNSEIIDEGHSVQDVYYANRDFRQHPSYEIPYTCNSQGNKTATVETSSPPQGLRYDIEGHGGNNCRYYLDKVEVELIDPVKGTGMPTKRTLWTGSIGARNGHVGGSVNSCELWFDKIPPEFGPWANSTTTGEERRTDSYDSSFCQNPYIAGITPLSVDKPANVPEDGKALDVEMNAGILYDNLGAKWRLQRFDITSDRPDKHIDTDHKDGKWYLVLNPDSNASEDYTVTINQHVYEGEDHPTSTSVTVHTFDYHFTFVDEDGKVISEQTVDYGKQVELPQLADGVSARYECDQFADWTNTTTGPKDRTVKVYHITDTLRGSGTQEDPYLIASNSDWESMRRDVEKDITGKFYRLENNLHVAGMVGTKDHPFSSTLDGNGKAIDVSLENNSDDVHAPFAYVRGATIKNLTVTGSVTGSSAYAGGLIGINLEHPDKEKDTGTLISNCTVYTDVSGYKYVGGLAIGFHNDAKLGENARLTIYKSSFRGSISADYYSGGFVGLGTKWTNLSNCLFDPDSAQTPNPGSSSTFVFYAYGTIRDCIYTEAHGIVQGQASTDYKFVFRDSQGKKFGEQIVHQGEKPQLPISDGDNKIVSWKCKECDDWNDTTNGIVKRNMIATFSNEFAFKGSGTESDPYLISNEDDWYSLNLRTLNHGSVSGEYYRMTNDISTDKMIGSASKPFSGSFDGRMHTLNVTLQNNDSNLEEAPFVCVNGGTIKNIRVTGSVTGDKDRASGLVGENKGATTISDVIVSAEVSGVTYIGGFCSINNGNLTITDSTYNGKLNVNSGAGFVGRDTGYSHYDSSDCVHIGRCLFAPAEGSGYNHRGDAFALASNGEFWDSYYTQQWVDPDVGSIGIHGQSFDVLPVSGSEAHPFSLFGHGAFGWDAFRLITEKKNTKGVYFRQDSYMKAFSSVGDGNHYFEGTFDGNGNTLEVYFNNNGENSAAAPFGYINDATIKGVTVKGQVHARRCAGMVLNSTGESTIDKCRMYADIKGTEYVGGYVSQAEHKLLISDSNFEGIINGENYCGGFIAYGSGATRIYGCYFMPSGTSTCKSGCTFIYGPHYTMNYIFYTIPFGDPQGMQLYNYSSENKHPEQQTGNYSGEKDYKPLLNTVKLISKIPEPAAMTLADKGKVQKARKAYDALTDEQKKILGDEFLKELVKAEAQIGTLHKNAAKDYKNAVEKAKKLTVTKVKVKAQKGRKAAVRWKKNKKADGYQIAWSTSKKFTKKTTKIRKIPKEKATKATINCTIKNLKKGKTYYFRIRTYSLVTNKVNGKVATVYGKWSGKKKVTIKK